MKIKTGNALAAMLVLILCFTSYAQSSSAIIRGTVTDKTGAVVTGAKIRLANAITNYSQETVTDGQGAFRLVDVPFNDYTLTTENPGFDQTSREVIVRSNLTQQFDIQLGVAPVRQEVNVSGREELVEAEKTAPSTVIDRNWI